MRELGIAVNDVLEILKANGRMGARSWRTGTHRLILLIQPTAYPIEWPSRG
jgi:hypothetical protein